MSNSDMMISGLLCSWCGVLMFDKQEPGFPRICRSCAEEDMEAARSSGLSIEFSQSIYERIDMLILRFWELKGCGPEIMFIHEDDLDVLVSYMDGVDSEKFRELICDSEDAKEFRGMAIRPSDRVGITLSKPTF